MQYKTFKQTTTLDLYEDSANFCAKSRLERGIVSFVALNFFLFWPFEDELDLN